MHGVRLGTSSSHAGKLLIILVGLILVSVVLAPVARAQTVVATITVGANPYGVAYDSMGEVFVTNSASDTVSVIPDSGSTANSVVATVSVGTYPVGAAYDSVKSEVFVTNAGSGTVSVISDSTNTVVASVTVGSYPYGAAFDSGAKEVFVPNDGSSSVSVISDSTNTVVATVGVGSYPFSAAYDPTKGEVFVTNEGSNTVSVISDATNTVVATVKVGSNPFGIAYDSGKGEVFVVNTGSSTVSVISATTNSVVATVNVGTNPYGAAYDSGKGEIYVTNAGSNTVSVISDSSNTLVGTVSVGSYPFGVAYDPIGEVFVTDEGSSSVSVISDKGPSTTSTLVSCVPSSVYVGSSTTCTATITGLSPTGTVTFTQSGTGSVTFPSPATCALSSGSCSLSVTGAGAGSDTIQAAYSGDTNNQASSGSTTLTVLSGIITLSPTQGPVGVSVAVSGTGFTPDVAISVLTFGGKTPTTQTCTSQTTSGTGTFACTFTVPSPNSSGTYAVVATGHDGGTDTASATFTVTTPAITLVPTGDPAGTSVTVTGSGFTPGITIGTFTFGGTTPTTQSCTTTTASSNGALSCTFTVPSDPSATYTVQASGSDVGTVPADSALASFTIPVTTVITITSTTYATSTSTISSATTVTTSTSLSSSVTTIVSTSVITSISATSCSTGTCNVTYLTVQCSSSYVAVSSKDTCQATVVGPVSTPTGNVVWGDNVDDGWTGNCILAGFSSYGTSYSSSCTVTYSPPSSPGVQVVLTATYGGDVLNLGSSGTYSLTVTTASTTTTTSCTPKSSVAGSLTTITCTANVTGYDPTGTVTWSQSGVGSVSLSQTSCTLSAGRCSVTMTGATAGSVKLTAAYGGDANNKASLRSTTVSVTKGPTSVVASCTPSTLAAGATVACTATVSGVYPLQTGTVNWAKTSGKAKVIFTVRSCTLSLESCSVTLILMTSGSFTIRANYAGDADNLRSSGNLVYKASPTLTPTLSMTAVPVNQPVTDKAAISGGFLPGGTITYEYFAGSTCSGTANPVGSPVTVTSEGVPGSIPQIFSTIGSYSWNAVYSGDANNNGATSPCQTIVVNAAGVSVSTLLLATTIAYGSPATDSATLSGATATAGGTVTYEYFSSGGYCSGTATTVSIVAVAAGVVPNSAPQVFAAPGSYSWNAVYSGDAHNNGATSPCEPLSVKGISTIAITLSASTIPVGGSVFASSLLTGTTSTAGGTVLYEYFSGNTCSGTAFVVGSAVTVANGVAPNSASQQFGTAGTYSWNAVYSGDAHNNGATSVCEPLTVGLTTTTTTTAAPATTIASAASGHSSSLRQPRSVTAVISGTSEYRTWFRFSGIGQSLENNDSILLAAMITSAMAALEP